MMRGGALPWGDGEWPVLGRNAMHGDAGVMAVDRLHRLVDGGPQCGDLVCGLGGGIVFAGAFTFRQRQ